MGGFGNDPGGYCGVERWQKLVASHIADAPQRLQIKLLPNHTREGQEVGTLVESVCRWRPMVSRTPWGRARRLAMNGARKTRLAHFRHQETHHLGEEERIPFGLLVEMPRWLPPVGPQWRAR